MQSLPLRCSYPLAGNLPALRAERAHFELVRATVRPTTLGPIGYRNAYLRIDADLAYNAQLIRAAELAQFGHLATSGAHLV
jgi:hypothetical protein